MRCTVNSPLHILDEGGVFKSDIWQPIYGIMTNLGLFRCDREMPLEILPKIMRLHRLKLTAVSGILNGKRNCFRLDYLNDKEKVSQKFFSVDDNE